MHVRTGFQRLERGIRERMTIQDPETVTPQGLISTTRPVMAAVREFFGGSQLSQFMDQTNPLAELTHKRRLSALGPGGLSRDRAGFDVRDVHPSHYGRICPIETPEGPNIGLIGSLATYGKINQYGFIETPYRRVISTAQSRRSGDRSGRPDPARRRGQSGERQRSIVEAEHDLTAANVDCLEEGRRAADPDQAGRVRRSSTTCRPIARRHVSIAQANTPLDENDRIIPRPGDGPRGRRSPLPGDSGRATSQYMDVSPKQVVSVATALIPFLEHDDANRALMGANMQRQAVPLLEPTAPIIGTGVEHQAARTPARCSSHATTATVLDVNAREIMHPRRRRRTSTSTTCRSSFARTRTPASTSGRACSKGDGCEAGQILADSSSTENGELALGQNVLVAFMPWEGGNFEDAILISERLVRDDVFTSIHIEKYETEARDTKLGPEEITRDIPNVGEDSLANLDESGIIRIGAEVRPNDILVGKVTPRGETELSAEERLLRRDLR